MRYLLFFILFMSCTYKIDDPGLHDYEGTVPLQTKILVESILDQYAPEASVYLFYGQPLSYNILGLANQLDKHTYLIQINPNTPNVESTIFHELGHVIDAEMNRLSFKNPMKWKGMPCDWTIPWVDRPWEQSANEWRDCLWYEYENGQLESYPYWLLNPIK